MVTVVAEFFARKNVWELSDNPIALHSDHLSIITSHDPFSTENLDQALRVVVDADEIGKAMRRLDRRVRADLILDAIDRHLQSGWFRNCFHRLLVNVLNSTSLHVNPCFIQ